MISELSRRTFIKVTSSATLATVLFPGCSLALKTTKTNINFRETSSTSEDEIYDYIIVGSGAGGGPVTARLVEAGFRVLLLEAGGSKDDPVINVPAFHGNSTEHPTYSWEFFVKHYENRTRQLLNDKYEKNRNGIFYPRATGLGGCTIHNAMITMYPDNSDWDNIVNVTGDRSWNPREMRRYFQKLEKNGYYEDPTDRRGFLRGIDFKKMGYKGWLSTEQSSPLLLLRDKQFKKVFASALGNEGFDEIKDILFSGKGVKFDPNTWKYVQNKLDGVFNVPKATENGRRSSTRNLILETKKRYPNRLTIRTHSLVSRVVLDENKKAVAVEVLEGEDLYQASPNYNPKVAGRKRAYKCTKEIILSGGAYNSPQVLMLSGIGDADELVKHDINPLVELPGVGKNLQDRYEVTVISKLKEPFSSLEGCKFGAENDPCYNDYLKDPKNHVYGSNGVIGGIIKRSEPSKKDPDLFIFGVPGYFKGYHKGWAKEATKSNYMTWAVLKGHTKNSKGFVKLKSSSPRETPNINFKYFDEGNGNFKDDLDSVVSGVKTVRSINERMHKIIQEEVHPGAKVNTDKEVESFIQNQSWGHHASCTNKMGLASDPTSVIDSNFKVHGVKGLRVVDASSFNKIPGLFIVVPIYMIAEKAAESIIKDSVNF